MFWGLILSLIVGLFFLIGILILKKTNHKEKMNTFAMSLAFVVMIGLLLFDLLPEILEFKNIYLIIPVFLGLILFIVLDQIIPYHHEHNHREHKHHLNHIGVITIFALALHNLIEGFTLYSVTLTSLKAGFLMMLSISLHNIPLGFQIGSQMENNKKSYLLIFILCISALLGSTINILIGDISELSNEIKGSLKKKETIYGIILGVVIIIITNLL